MSTRDGDHTCMAPTKTGAPCRAYTGGQDICATHHGWADAVQQEAAQGIEDLLEFLGGEPDDLDEDDVADMERAAYEDVARRMQTWAHKLPYENKIGRWLADTAEKLLKCNARVEAAGDDDDGEDV